MELDDVAGARSTSVLLCCAWYLCHKNIIWKQCLF